MENAPEPEVTDFKHHLQTIQMPLLEGTGVFLHPLHTYSLFWKFLPEAKGKETAVHSIKGFPVVHQELKVPSGTFQKGQ